MTDRRSPKGVPLLALKLNTASVPQLSQPSSSSSRDLPWEGNIGAKRFFLGTREGEGLSDEELFKLFLQKEGELFTSKNSQTPFQYIKTVEVCSIAFPGLSRVLCDSSPPIFDS